MISPVCYEPGGGTGRHLIDGEQLFQEPCYKEALEVCLKATQAVPQNGKAWHARAQAEVMCLKYQSCRKAVNHGLEIDPQNKMVWFTCGQLTGKTPFPGKGEELIARIKLNQPLKPSDLNSEVLKEMDVLVLRCLAKDKKDRYLEPAHVKNELEKVIKIYLAQKSGR
jgi:hypothetical protein